MRNNVRYHPPSFVGAGFEIDYGFHSSPFGQCLLMVARGSVIGLAFTGGDKAAALEDMMARWPQASYKLAPQKIISFARKIFQNEIPPLLLPPLLLIGTDFQQRVWKKLLAIPAGRTVNYGALAERLGCPQAARAVGRAVGQNPISWLVPCHRVLRRDGALGGYHWGLDIKEKMLAAENYRQAA